MCSLVLEKGTVEMVHHVGKLCNARSVTESVQESSMKGRGNRKLFGLTAI